MHTDWEGRKKLSYRVHDRLRRKSYGIYSSKKKKLPELITETLYQYTTPPNFSYISIEQSKSKIISTILFKIPSKYKIRDKLNNRCTRSTQ